MAEPRLRAWPLIAIALIEVVHAGVAIWQHRAPAVHDGFQYFTLQYFFLNNAIQSGEVAQWIPFMTQGTVATFWYGVQGSFLQNVLLQIPWLVRNADLLTVFHVGVLVDLLILLTGTWMLARRFFTVPGAAFVTLSVIGSCVWLDQPYWTFRLYYAVPLVLALMHRFFDSGRWRWLLLAGNLLALQTIGNLPYFIPVVSFVVAAYFVLYAAANVAEIRQQVKRLQWGVPAATAIALTAASMLLCYEVLTIGIDELVSFNPGRRPDGRIDLDGFLSYGGHTDLGKWIDLLFNLSPWLDMTLYAGVLIGPLLIVGIAGIDRKRLHFVLLSFVVLLFTLGSLVAVALFYVWPGMQYFRHIGLVSPLVKVLLCFVAGVGFERAFVEGARRSRATQLAVVAGVAVLALSAWVVNDLSRSRQSVSALVDRLSDPAIARPTHTGDPVALVKRLRTQTIVAGSGAMLLALTPLLWRRRTLAATNRLPVAFTAAALAFVAVDVYRFKFSFLVHRSDIVFDDIAFMTRPSPMPFAPHRYRDFAEAAASSPRANAALVFNRSLFDQHHGRRSRGTQYWSANAFLFVDEAAASFRVDSWLKPLDQCMRMYRGDPIDGEMTLPRELDTANLLAPFTHPAAAVLAGMTAGKIRFFDRAYAASSPRDLVPLMTAQSYKGNLLYVLADAAEDTGAVRWTGKQALSADETRLLPYDVRQFDANNLIVRVSNPGSSPKWMSYADVWHPLWRAEVNGDPVPVYRANMAYKAVQLRPGENLVRFHFGSRLFSALAMLFAANALMWLVIIGWLAVARASPAHDLSGRD